MAVSKETKSNWSAEVINDELIKLLKLDLEMEGQLMSAGYNLEYLVYQAVQNGIGETVVRSFSDKQREHFERIHSRFEVMVDDNIMTDILNLNTNNYLDYPFQIRYNRLSKIEKEAANLQSGKPVMHVGTGWPGTAIGLYNQYGIPVTCVEIDQDVAKKSKTALEKIGFYGKDKLQIILANGANLNTENYSAVIISAMIPTGDKEKIIDNMRRLATGEPSDPLLILRTPPDLARSLFYQPLPTNIINRSSLQLIADTGGSVGRNDHLKSLVYKVMPMAEFHRGFDSILINTISRLNPPTPLPKNVVN